LDYSKIASPAFIVDEKLLRKNLQLLKSLQEEAGINILLAFKGFALWKVFPLIREYLKGAAASSLYEARLCYEEMKTYAHVYSPAYLLDDFKDLLKYSSYIVFNSFNQFQKFYPLTHTADHHISCGIRINPEFSDVKTGLYNPASTGSRLGVGSNEFPENLPEGIEGLHFHVLCESDSYSLEKVLKHVENKFGRFLHMVKWINMGGGHLITGEGYDCQHLIGLLQKFKSTYNTDIILEPGSAVAWNTGLLVSTVQDVVTHKGIKTAILDVSFTAHMPDTLEMPYRPAIIGTSDPHEKSEYLYRLGGSSCLAGDYLEEYHFNRALKPGDKVIFKDMAHYTMVKTTMFNGVKHPSIAILTEEGQIKTVREFHYEDYKNRLS
jgi:carboxynorspermidine decarboxylase